MPRALPFDTKEYTCIRAPVVDTAEVVRTVDGATVTSKLDEPFHRRLCQNMNAQFEQTGDLSPIIIGHTEDGKSESDYQSVGYLHNYDFENWEGTKATLADHWFRNENTVVVEGVPLKLSVKDVIHRWPRRSGEIWLRRCTIDPHCLLGATAPERPLGLLRLSKDGGDTAITYSSPGDLKVADEKKVDNSNVNDLPIVKTLEALAAQLAPLAQLVPALQQLLEGASAQPGGAPEGAKGAEGAPAGGEGEGSDPELEALMSQLQSDDEGGGPKDEPKPKKDEPKDDSPAKLSAELEVKELKLKLARRDIKDSLVAAGLEADDKTLDTLEKYPEADRTFLISKMTKPAGQRTNPEGLDAALKLSRQTGRQKIATREDQEKIVKLAKEKGLTIGKAAAELGYETSAT